nr:beta-propeller fold lactonase family protein [Stakelama flava]
MLSPDLRRYLVGTWTFTEPDAAQQTPLFWLGVTYGTKWPGLSIERIASDAAAVYYGARDPAREGEALLLHNDASYSAMSRQLLSADGELCERARLSSGGIGGSYISFDATGRFFVVANAHTGWSVFRDSQMPQRIADFANIGSGPHPRQQRSHPHCAIFSAGNRTIYAADMGTDEVLSCDFDPTRGVVGSPRVAYRSAPGAGPRHLLTHRERIYLLNELGNTLVVLRETSAGELTEEQVVSTLPDNFAGDSHTAHLAMNADATALLASNRGHDTIVQLTLNSSGLVSARNWWPSGGHWPWFFDALENGDILVANALSDNIAMLSLNAKGDYIIASSISVPHPVFLMPL